ncbi:hypothetical protein Hanom_Chr10g00939651 [Helianthus anomalus]
MKITVNITKKNNIRILLARPGKQVGSGRVGSWVKTGSGQNGSIKKRVVLVQVETGSG